MHARGNLRKQKVCLAAHWLKHAFRYECPLHMWQVGICLLNELGPEGEDRRGDRGGARSHTGGTTAEVKLR